MTKRATTPSDMAFFEARVFRPETPCWNWRAYVGNNGYGKWVRSDRQASAHRIAYELLVGPIPDGMQLHHTCFNRSCVNPAHLKVVTPAENKAASMNVGVANAAKTHCAQGHPFDAENTIVRKRGRVCRACRDNANRERWEKIKATDPNYGRLDRECKNGHPRTPENTRVLKSGVRTCVICIRETAQKKRRAKGSIPWAERRAAQTHCIHGHEFTPENTYATSTGGRLCRACGRESSLRSYYAKKAAS